jgi:hypothetical protein
MKPVDSYKQYLPQTMNTPTSDTSPYYNELNSVAQHGQNATDIAATRSQNRQNYQQLVQQQKEFQRQRQLAQAQIAAARDRKRAVVRANNRPVNVNFSGGGTVNVGGKVKPGHLNLSAPMKTYHWHQFALTLNSSVANRFIGFLNALSAKGYHPKTIGSYANRNIAGTNTRSLHSYGLAIDIDPSRNPVTWNGHNITALPPGVGSLAARYGLKWGGSWIHSKRDTMHFSVPAYGLE